MKSFPFASNKSMIYFLKLVKPMSYFLVGIIRNTDNFYVLKQTFTIFFPFLNGGEGKIVNLYSIYISEKYLQVVKICLCSWYNNWNC